MTCSFWYLRNLRKRRILGIPRSYDARLESVAYPSLAGTFGAHSVLFAKSTAEIVKQTARGENQFVNFASYFIIFFLFAFLFAQMRMLNEGLSKADALVIVPVYQVCWVTMNTVVGMIYFEDYKQMIPRDTVLFLLGVAITLVGVFLLSKRDSNTKTTKLTGQIQEEGGYIEEVVSSLDDTGLPGEGLGLSDIHALDELSPNKFKEHDNEEIEVRNPFLDTAPSPRSADLLSTIKNSSQVLSSASSISEPVSPAPGTEKPLDIGDVEGEEDEGGNAEIVQGLDVDEGPNPVHHPPAKAGTHSHSFSLSWSWWARGGTRKLYTPLF